MARFVSIVALVVSASVATGCASVGAGYVPVVDMQGKSQQRFDEDLADCQSIAASNNRSANLAAAGALIFGVVGAILAPRGLKNEIGGQMAAIGAGTGAADGVGTQQDIVKRCMAGRGYSVLA